jgi:hypothetical protein
MKTTLISRLVLGLTLAGLAPAVHPQAKRGPASPPRIEIKSYKIETTLTPDAHELEAVATVTLKALEDTGYVFFELSENLSVQRVLNSEGVEIEFGQDEAGPGTLSVRFSEPLAAGKTVTIKIEYQGGYDRDRFSRIYTRDEGSAYIGMEGSYLMY